MADIGEFRALARSAPWLWQELDVTVTRPGRPVVRARLTRGDATAEVTEVGGDRLQEAEAAEPQGGAATFGWTPRAGEGPDGGEPRGGAASLGWTAWAGGDPDAAVAGAASRPARPLLREDGLVAARPHGVADPPFYSDYQWVALFDPVELADGRECEPDDAEAPRTHDAPAPLLDEAGWPRPRTDLQGAEVLELRPGEHHGRPVWWARLRPTANYEPRCGCCALLPHPAAARREYGEKDARRLGLLDGAQWPEFEVALDRATGVVTRLSGPDGACDVEIHSAR